MGLRVRQYRRQLGLATAVCLCVLLSGAVVGNTEGGVKLAPPDRELRFARLAYNGNYLDRGGFGGASWQTDAPDAEYHLLMGIRRLTRIDAIDSQRVTAALPCEST